MFDKPKRIAGIDWGEKRIGYAYSDPTFSIASPIKTFIGNSIEKIATILKEDNIVLVIIGVPYRNDNKNDILIAKIEAYAEELNKLTGLNVVKVDEAFTSKKANSILILNKKKKNTKEDKASLDMVAASVILQDFLDSLDFQNNYKQRLLQ